MRFGAKDYANQKEYSKGRTFFARFRPILAKVTKETTQFATCFLGNPKLEKRI